LFSFLRVAVVVVVVVDGGGGGGGGGVGFLWCALVICCDWLQSCFIY
jgi:hypothetical protein